MNASPSLASLARDFARIGFLSFGGPAPQITMLHDLAVEKRGWISDTAFLRALNVCHLLPGPEAMQLATWIGWQLGGIRGGLITGGLFVLPGALVMLALSILYVLAADLTLVEGAFFGVKAAVLVILLGAVIRLASRTVKTPAAVAIAGAAFIALSVGIAFPIVIAAAGLAGWLASRAMAAGHHEEASDSKPAGEVASIKSTALSLAIWAAIWLAPLALAALILTPSHRLVELAGFFSWLALVSFGGAYAVLAWMAQAGVEQYGWLSAGEMADGLGLAESTPGPLILVTQFTGFLAGYRVPEPFGAMAGGIIGAALTLWAVFLPSFMAIFTLAPWMERLNRIKALQSALAGISAAVVGVIASLGVWFAVQILFADTGAVRFGPLRVVTADIATVEPWVIAIAALCAVLAFVLKRGVMTLVAAGLAAGLALSLTGLI
ncbi:MAG: chromate efflux transporter [Oceanicaulis sp.]|uniref:chromate efflux transporter n=1 Tax=Glycocaulis sp. TaxID=1969725 RepID=UPI0025BC8051|nr:chromate efflux transporter [Glycocaulis sp.]MCC5981715.1 chromate efflux transporter [Oceanicaulis sp.]MCH8520743.1 chromate efflux transporter [Glycocaulis sp.]